MTCSGQERTGPGRLLYKEDWPEAKERFRALWAGEIVDRACISIKAPKDEQCPVPAPANWEARWTDIDYVIARTNIELGNTYFGGEAFPVGSTFLGYAAYGGEVVFDEHTIWVHPSIHDWETPYRFDPENRWCQRFIELTWALIKDGHGSCKYLVNTAGILTPMDALMYLRGSQRLCIDLLEYPDAVRATWRELMRAYKWVFDIRHERIPREHGWAAWGLWAPGRYSVTECDFSTMISSKHFREFVVPEIEEIAGSLDYCIYHLDGSEALHHLPTVLQIEALDAIQWVRGAGDLEAGSALRWVPVCREVQAAGKVVQMEVKYKEVEPLLRELDPRRLFIVTSAPSVEAADTLLRRAEHWSCTGLFSVPSSIKAGGAQEQRRSGRNESLLSLADSPDSGCSHGRDLLLGAVSGDIDYAPDEASA